MHEARAAIGVILLLTLGMLSVASAATCENNLTVDAGVVQGEQTYSCARLTVHGTWDVANGGSLKLTDVQVQFEGSGGILVRTGGSLHVSGSTLSGPAGGFRLEQETGGKGTFTASVLERATPFSSSGILNLVDVDIQDGGAVGLLVPTGTATLVATTISGSATALHAKGGAQVTATGLHTVDTSYANLRFGGFARAIVESASLAQALNGVIVEDASQVSIRNTTLDESVQPAAIGGPGQGPLLRLQGSAADVDEIEFTDAGRVEQSWFARVQVASDPKAPLADLAGVQVEFVSAGEQFQALTSSTGLTPTVSLLTRTKDAGTTPQDFDTGSWSISARKGSSFGGLEQPMEIAANHVDQADRFVITVSNDPDSDPPVWKTTSPLKPAASAYSKDGATSLLWTAANDTLEGAKPHRGIAWYEVLLVAPGRVPVEAVTASTTWSVQGLEEGNHSVTVRAVDFAGNRGPYSNVQPITVDLTEPVLKSKVEPQAHQTFLNESLTVFFTNRTTALSAEAKDNLSGPPSVAMKLAGQGTFTPISTQSFTTQGNHSVVLQATDKAGNVRQEKLAIVVDGTPPLLQPSLTPPNPDGDAGWFTTPVHLSVIASDAIAGVQSREFKIADGPWKGLPDSGATINASVQGSVHLRATDRSGNQAVTALAIKVDVDKPVLDVQVPAAEGSGGWHTGPVNLTAVASDAMSGLRRLEAKIGSGPWTEFASPFVLTGGGELGVSLRAIDVAGNGNETSLVVPIDRLPPIPPVPQYRSGTGGQVTVDWSRGPPLDTISGLATASLEVRGRATTASSVPLRIDQATQVVTIPSPGNSEVRVTVVDQAGHNASSAWVTVHVAGGQQPAMPRGIARGVHELQLETLPGFTPTEVRLYVDGTLVDAVANDPFVLSWETREVLDGPHTVTLLALDAQGRQVEQPYEFTVANGYTATVLATPIPFAVAAAALAMALATGASGYLVHRRASRAARGT